MAKLYDPILQAMKVKAGFQALDVNEGKGRLRILGRVPQSQTTRNTLNWLIVAYRLLKASNQVYKVDVSKQYFIKNDRIVFAWRLVFEGNDLEKYYEFITNVVKESPQTATFDLSEEVPLHGVAADRNNTAGGKRGASSVFRGVVGPEALAAKNRGG